MLADIKYAAFVKELVKNITSRRLQKISIELLV
jgi:hypothetical protein